MERNRVYYVLWVVIQISRARDWTHPITGETVWFDSYDTEATVRQIEILAEMEGSDIDDLLDERLSTKAVLFRLNDNSGLIPRDIIEIKKARVQVTQTIMVCRYHGEEGCEGRLTRHHFVPRWLMLEISEYTRFAPRARCTIPACVGWHRDLHKRSNGTSKSIAPYLTDSEKKIAHHIVGMLRQERPKIYALLAAGDRNSYEHQLIQDWRRGLFDVIGEEKKSFPRWQIRAHSSTS